MKAFFNDTVLLLLFIATFSFAGLLIFVKFKFPNDDKIFQVMSGLVSGFAGAILLRINPQTKEEKDSKIPGAAITQTEHVQTTVTNLPETTIK